MIQRIQTLYLFLSVLFLGFMFAFPYTLFIDQNTIAYVFDFFGVYKLEAGTRIMGVLPLEILISVVFLINLITIFLFKNRILQMRLCVFNMLLMLGILVLSGYYITYIKKQLNAQVYYKITLLLPLISLLFTWLSFRNIRKDELLIRSVDRIR